jgi:DGC domain
MPALPRRKVGLIACGGEELAEGTLTRVAIRLVLEKYRPDDTVTLCLPLFLAGEREERAFARFYPTVAIDGCSKECARRATAKFSAPVAAAVRVDELLAEMGIAAKPAWRRALDDEGWAAAERLAAALAGQVDALLGPHPATEQPPAAVEGDHTGSPLPPAAAPCACATQIPISQIELAGRTTELVALMAVFDQFYQAGRRSATGIGPQLLETVRIYNPVPDADLADLQAALEREYAQFCRQRSQP